MNQRSVKENIIIALDFSGCPEGKVFSPLAPENDITKKYFLGWSTPLAPRDGFNLDSFLEVVKEKEESIIRERFGIKPHI